MALKDEIFQKHLNNTKKSFNKKYNHFRPFDDPDHQKKLLVDPKQLITSNQKEFTITDYPNNQENDNFVTYKANDRQKHKPDTNQTQTQHKPDTNPTQTGYISVTNGTQTGHKTQHKSEHKLNTNSTQKNQHKYYCWGAKKIAFLYLQFMQSKWH